MKKQGRLQDKIALITGASGGQGLVEAELFAAEGAVVILADVSDKPGKALARTIVKRGGRAAYINLDVTKTAHWTRAVKFAQREFGGIHVLVNNAGVVSRTPVADVTDREWALVLAINLTGPMIGTRAVLPLMRDSGGGSIVNISSTVAQPRSVFRMCATCSLNSTTSEGASSLLTRRPPGGIMVNFRSRHTNST